MILETTKMMEKDDVSASTRFRYRKVQRQQHLNNYISFKRQNEKLFSPQRIADIKRVYHHGICGRNQHKHLVVLDRIGNVKVQEFNKLFEEDELVSFINQRMIELCEHHLEQKDQIIWIIDLNGRIMQLASKKVIDQLVKIIRNLQTYFPDVLYRLVFVNTPMLFDTIWNKLLPSIHPHTQEKILMVGDELQNLYEFAEPSILPDFLGGDVELEEFLSGQEYHKKQKEEEEQQQDQQQVDFSQLKAALGGLKIPGRSLQSVSQTPLNTEADENK